MLTKRCVQYVGLRWNRLVSRGARSSEAHSVGARDCLALPPQQHTRPDTSSLSEWTELCCPGLWTLLQLYNWNSGLQCSTIQNASRGVIALWNIVIGYGDPCATCKNAISHGVVFLINQSPVVAQSGEPVNDTWGLGCYLGVSGFVILAMSAVGSLGSFVWGDQWEISAAEIEFKLS